MQIKSWKYVRELSKDPQIFLKQYHTKMSLAILLFWYFRVGEWLVSNIIYIWLFIILTWRKKTAVSKWSAILGHNTRINLINYAAQQSDIHLIYIAVLDKNECEEVLSIYFTRNPKKKKVIIVMKRRDWTPGWIVPFFSIIIRYIELLLLFFMYIRVHMHIQCHY